MRLIRLTAENYRSLKDIEITFAPLAILIGENDAGKSTVLDLIGLCLTDQRPDPDRDFYRDIDGNSADTITAILEFECAADEEDAAPYLLGGKLRVRYTFRPNEAPEKSYWGEAPSDERFNQNFAGLEANAQRDLLRELDPSLAQNDISNGTKRAEKWEELRSAAPKTAQWLTPPAKWGSFLPRFERYSAMEYNVPERMIEKTLRQVYEGTILEEITADDGTTTRRLIEPLRQVEQMATQEISEQLAHLKGHIKRYNPRVQDVDYVPNFNFRNSLQTGEFQVNSGHGLHALTRTGAGTRWRMFLAILAWDREVTLAQAKSGERLPPIIRGYDEPDTNLHYDAQRRMYQTIADIVDAADSRIQAILCTHSLSMIDRAPAQHIRHLGLTDDGHTTVNQLETDEDPEIEHFLHHLAREMGITNTIIFYERCFILIEGETEENALPIFYRRLHKCSMLEDGIRIINVQGNGAVKEFLKLFCRNRKELTIVFQDRDTVGQRANALAEQELRTAGFDDTFINERLLYIGIKEFEDAFCDEAYVNCLQQGWPRSTEWTCAEIAPLRGSEKFSAEITKLVWTETQTPCKKPELGKKMAEHCAPEHIPQEIHRLFDLARAVAQVAP